MFYSRMQSVQDPIIPLVAQWTRETPGTISLGQGIVSYPPPPQVLSAITQLPENSLNLHRYHHVQGLVSLRELILEKLAQENHIQLQSIEQIVVTAGSNMGFMNAVLSLTVPGDEIILQTPYYFNHEMAIRMADCVPVCVETYPNHQLNLDQIEAAITPKTKAIVTISPNNPTGAVYSAADLKYINQLCQARGIIHISDEAYEYFVYDGVSHCSPAQFDENSCHTISLFSLSKAYGFAGWRIGYMVIPLGLQSAIQKIQDTILICPPLIAQVAAEAALKVGKIYPQQALPTLNETRHFCWSALQKLGQHCEVFCPQGAFYFFIKINSSASALELTQALIQQFQVAVIPGNTFGCEGCYLRVAYGALEPHTAQAGIERFVRGIEALS